MRTQSWMIVRLSDGKAVREVIETKGRIDRYNATAKHHRAVTALEYLAAYARAVKRAGGVEPKEVRLDD